MPSGSARSVAQRLVAGFERQGPVWGNFDVSRVDQVITNLLSNAIRYGRGKPIVIGAVSARRRRALLGRGPRHRHPARAPGRIFQQYERAAPSTSYAGLGLGLWISRQLVEAMGGTISVRSEVDAGSIFTVEIPRGGMSGDVLVVDDDADLREDVAAAPGRQRLRRPAVSTGQAALESPLRTAPPDASNG